MFQFLLGFASCLALIAAVVRLSYVSRTAAREDYLRDLAP